MLVEVIPPTAHLPTDENLFTQDGRGRRIPNIPFLKTHFCQEGRLKEAQAIEIIETATNILDKEPNLLHVEAPITGSYLPSFL